jgi:hypothetical protein
MVGIPVMDEEHLQDAGIVAIRGVLEELPVSLVPGLDLLEHWVIC